MGPDGRDIGAAPWLRSQAQVVKIAMREGEERLYLAEIPSDFVATEDEPSSKEMQTSSKELRSTVLLSRRQNRLVHRRRDCTVTRNHIVRSLARQSER
jgi:hypothetical protein